MAPVRALVAFRTLLVFHLSARLSGSRWLAAGVALLTALADPRLYSYPKVFLYVAAIGLAWLYAHRSTRVHVSLMAALTAAAFRLRHDHGVYIAVMLLCILGLRGGAATTFRETEEDSRHVTGYQHLWMLLAVRGGAPCKAPFLSGCESRPATVAPAGRSRSGRWR